MKKIFVILFAGFALIAKAQEVGGGIGYQYVFGQKEYSKGSYVAYNLLLRIGYTF